MKKYLMTSNPNIDYNKCMKMWRCYTDTDLLSIITSLKTLGYIDDKINNEGILEQLRGLE